MRGLLWLLRKYNYILVFIFLETVALILLSNHTLYQHSVLVNVNREISGTLYESIEGAREYLNLRQNNEMLVRENARLRNKLESLENSVSDSLSMDYTGGNYFYTPARIVHSTHFKQFNFLTIDKGRKQGVTRDMAVIGEEGIVGIVLESSANFATVLPVINRDFRLSAKIRKSDFTGILQWEGTSPRVANLNEIPFHAEPEVGDTIVTSGYSAVFPEGLFVGTIRDYSLEDGNFYRINVDLGTDFQRLFYVNVINNFFRKEQVELENKVN